MVRRSLDDAIAESTVAVAFRYPGLTEARELAEQQGGRVTGDLTAHGVTVWMPRR